MQRFINDERSGFFGPSAFDDVLRGLDLREESREASGEILACLARIQPGHVELLRASLARLGLESSVVVDGVSVKQLGLLAPNILVVDLDRFDVDPYETLRMLRFVLPNCLIAVYTDDLTRERAVGCHMAGANCLLSKASDESSLTAGFRQARESGCFTDPSFIKQPPASRNIGRKDSEGYMVSFTRRAATLFRRVLRSVAITGSLLLSASVPATAAAQDPLVGVAHPRAHRSLDSFRANAARQSRADHHDSAVGER